MLLKLKPSADTLKCFYSIAKAEHAVDNSFFYNHICGKSITPVFTPEFTSEFCKLLFAICK